MNKSNGFVKLSRLKMSITNKKPRFYKGLKDLLYLYKVEKKIMNQNLPFRNLDNSSSTQMQYRLEAEHWNNAYSSNRINKRTTNISEVFGLVACIVRILLTVLTIVLSMLFWVLNRFFK